MANPASRQELVDYAKRQLGYPVLEINLADEQIEDLLDDTIQMYQNRHMDGVELMYLKYKVDQQFIDAVGAGGDSNVVGITTTSTTANITGVGSTGVGITTFRFEETQNFIQIPDAVIGIEKVWKLDNRAISTNMFSVNYQLFLNEIYWFSSTELLNYTMTKRYLEDINFILHPDKQIRFNRRQNRLYIDTDAGSLKQDDYLIIQCYRALDPNEFTKVYNDPFLKRYFTALMKRQWGQNMMKFRGVKLPGGVELNGRELYEDGQRELVALEEAMFNTYELPPMDMIG
jgi:hypothetical protein|tara:strand:+ start:5149 stop:6009 length:861 start_codon:yes stop_codon:yes gene_type:complete